VFIGSKSQNEPQPRVLRDLPKPSPGRLLASLKETPFNLERRESTAEIAREHGTVLYLAYGSNLCYQTFQKSRGVKPLAQVNVLVPELRLTFDLPGLPYAEPCFANTARRDPTGPKDDDELDKLEKELAGSESDPLTQKKPKYHKDRWSKGLVGVVYEVSPSDYAHIIATEGGGSSYQDILVSCYPLSDGDDVVPEHPDSLGKPFKAHTLFSPPTPHPKPDKPKHVHNGRSQRPDPSYAQPSARYLKLLRDGADEHALPAEYKDYVKDIRPYTMTSQAQRLGQFVFLGLWAPFIVLLISLQRTYQDKNGRSPKWLIGLSNGLFTNMWRSYDGFFRPIFGDGERTDYTHKDGDEQVDLAPKLSVLDKVASFSGKKRGGDEELAKLEDLASQSLLD
jgi:hypothetical protein